jgi:hypothetical protein
MTYSPDHTAEVRAHNQVMRYSRFGSGALLLLLRDTPRDPWSTLQERLAAHFKVIVPNIPAGTADVPGWLTNLLEGLGATDLTVVAVGRHCDAGIALALGDHDLVSRVVLIADPDSAPPGDRLPAARGSQRVRLFVVPRTADAENAIALTLRYLGEGAAG